MRGTELHWVKGPWRGKLAMASRPRGGDWLPEEMQAWRSEGVDTLVSMLEPSEEAELDLSSECVAAQQLGMRFRSFPIPDRDVPQSESAFAQLVQVLEAELVAGRNVALHCRQGVGRTGLVAAGLLVSEGSDLQEVVDQLSIARGVRVPETSAQRVWLEHFAEIQSAAR